VPTSPFTTSPAGTVHNPHAHILATTEIGSNSFSMKKTGSGTRETLLAWREAWAKHANRALEQAQSQTRIDHRSYKDRGITKAPDETQQEWHQQKQIATKAGGCGEPGDSRWSRSRNTSTTSSWNASTL